MIKANESAQGAQTAHGRREVRRARALAARGEELHCVNGVLRGAVGRVGHGQSSVLGERG